MHEKIYNVKQKLIILFNNYFHFLQSVQSMSQYILFIHRTHLF